MSLGSRWVRGVQVSTQAVAWLADSCALASNAVGLPDLRGAGRTARWRCRGRGRCAGRGKSTSGSPLGPAPRDPGSSRLARFRVSPDQLRARVRTQPVGRDAPGNPGASVPRARRPRLTRDPGGPPPSAPRARSFPEEVAPCQPPHSRSRRGPGVVRAVPPPQERKQARLLTVELLSLCPGCPWPQPCSPSHLTQRGGTGSAGRGASPPSPPAELLRPGSARPGRPPAALGAGRARARRTAAQTLCERAPSPSSLRARTARRTTT